MKKSIKYHCITVFFILIIFSGCQGIYENGKELAADILPHVQQINVDELNAKIENSEDFFLIDIRQPEEFEKSNIPYSTSIPRGLLELKIADKTFWEEEQWHAPKKDDEIIIYCKKGLRGIMATKSLLELGYSNVKNLKGGISAWDPEFNSETEAAEEDGCGG